MIVCDVVKNSIWYDPRVKKQIKSYVNNGIEVVCVGVKDPRFNENEVEKLPCRVLLSDIKQKYYSKSRTIFMKFVREIKTNRDIYKFICKIKPDIIHANDLNALIPAYKACKKTKSILVYDSHEIFLENPWIANNRFVKAIWSFFEKRIIKKVDLFVCVSNAALSYFLSKYSIKKHLVITNCVNPVNLNLFHQKSQNKIVLNHGVFYEGRGYELMIQTAALFNDNNLCFMLRGFGPLEDDLKTLSKKLKTSNVIFADPVHVDELIPFASEAWLGVAITEPISLNFELSVSNKLFEYAAAGLPIIMSKIPEHIYLNEKYKIGIILEKNTPDCLANAINTFLNDSAFYNKCRDNAILLSQSLNWDGEFKKMVEAECKMFEDKNGQKKQ